MTVLEALDAAAARLARSGVASARLDAALLLAEVLHVDRVELRLRPGVVLSEDDERRFETLVARRAARVPIAQILGRCEFFSRDFEVTADVLTPRPETEDVVQAVLDRRSVFGAAPDIADVGVGSGCIAVTLALELSGARVTAFDVSDAALAVAARNAARHGVADRVRMTKGSYLTPEGGAPARDAFDVVVSNPPYVAHGERESVDPEVLHEPSVAVFAPGDPAQVYRCLAEQCAVALRPGGWLVCELPEDPDGSCRAAVRGVVGLELVEERRDLAGIVRVSVARRAR